MRERPQHVHTRPPRIAGVGTVAPPPLTAERHELARRHAEAQTGELRDALFTLLALAEMHAHG